VSVTLDANLLLYASDNESPFHDRALEALEALSAGPEILYVFWPAAMAYMRIATHHNVFEAPLSHGQAVANLDSLLARPNVRSPGEDEGFLAIYRAASEGAGVRGNLVPDAHLVALMRQYGVRTIVSHDRDFKKFDGIEVRDPFA
jgi:hypothetical protein